MTTKSLKLLIWAFFGTPVAQSDDGHQRINSKTNTLQPLYNMVCLYTVLDITQFKDGSQKCIDYIEK